MTTTIETAKAYVRELNEILLNRPSTKTRVHAQRYMDKTMEFFEFYNHHYAELLETYPEFVKIIEEKKPHIINSVNYSFPLFGTFGTNDEEIKKLHDCVYRRVNEPEPEPMSEPIAM